MPRAIVLGSGLIGAVMAADLAQDRDFAISIADARPEVIVTAAYGLILPSPVLRLAPRGALNVHASLLPRWRGAAPIQRALLAGDRETGITIMRMDVGLDTGPILAQRSVRIAGDVHSDSQQPERDERGKRVRRFRDDPAIRILVSSEVGSEGLDFQFAHHVVNYDLPWNPRALEQRIGRVERVGSQFETFNHYYILEQGAAGDTLARLMDKLRTIEEEWK